MRSAPQLPTPAASQTIRCLMSISCQSAYIKYIPIRIHNLSLPATPPPPCTLGTLSITPSLCSTSILHYMNPPQSLDCSQQFFYLPQTLINFYTLQYSFFPLHCSHSPPLPPSTYLPGPRDALSIFVTLYSTSVLPAPSSIIRTIPNQPR